MRYALALFTVAALAGVARADRVVEPPAGWVSDDNHAKRVQSNLDVRMPEDSTVEVWSYAPPEKGAQLIVSAITVPVGGDVAGAWVRTRIDELHDTPALMAGDDGKTRTISWSEKADEANLEWANDDIGTQSLVRAVWVARKHAEGAPDTVEELRAECVMAIDGVAQVRPLCEKALASMALPAAADRVAIATPAAVKEPGDDDDAVVLDGGVATPPAGATIDTAPPGPPGPIISTRPASSGGRDLRPFWVAGGLLVLIASLLWGRKKRSEALASEEGKPGSDKDE